MRLKQTPHHNNSEIIDYLKCFLKTNITTKTIINQRTLVFNNNTFGVCFGSNILKLIISETIIN